MSDDLTQKEQRVLALIDDLMERTLAQRQLVRQMREELTGDAGQGASDLAGDDRRARQQNRRADGGPVGAD